MSLVRGASILREPAIPSRRLPSASRSRVSGLSLIEVLVSVLILGIGLLGIAAMQSMALRGGQSSLESSQVVISTNSIIEAMRANRANAANYNTGGKRCAVTGGATLAGNDVDNWITSLQTSMPGNTTCGTIALCPNACVITVEWDDSRALGGAARTMVTEARI